MNTSSNTAPKRLRNQPTRSEFKRWLDEHPEPEALHKAYKRIDRLSSNNFGDWLYVRHRMVFDSLWDDLMKRTERWPEVRG